MERNRSEYGADSPPGREAHLNPTDSSWDDFEQTRGRMDINNLLNTPTFPTVSTAVPIPPPSSIPQMPPRYGTQPATLFAGSSRQHATRPLVPQMPPRYGTQSWTVPERSSRQRAARSMIPLMLPRYGTQSESVPEGPSRQHAVLAQTGLRGSTASPNLGPAQEHQQRTTISPILENLIATDNNRRGTDEADGELKYSKFTPEEDKIVREGMRTGNFSAVCEKIPRKSLKQIRLRASRLRELIRRVWAGWSSGEHELFLELAILFMNYPYIWGMTNHFLENEWHPKVLATRYRYLTEEEQRPTGFNAVQDSHINNIQDINNAKELSYVANQLGRLAISVRRRYRELRGLPVSLPRPTPRFFKGVTTHGPLMRTSQGLAKYGEVLISLFLYPTRHVTIPVNLPSRVRAKTGPIPIMSRPDSNMNQNTTHRPQKMARASISGTVNGDRIRQTRVQTGRVQKTKQSGNAQNVLSRVPVSSLLGSNNEKTQEADAGMHQQLEARNRSVSQPRPRNRLMNNNELNILRELVHHLGTTKWEEIAQNMGGNWTASELRGIFSSLRSVEIEPWTEDEDRELLHTYTVTEGNWTIIMQRLPRRSKTAALDRFYHLSAQV